jgi:signal transduction histidine kinase
MKPSHIRFAPDILRRLGEELNPNPDRGILELVKNAYDADATECKITLLHADRKGGAISIVDNGDGMSRDAIDEGWLVLGRSNKSPKSPTRLKRIPSGNKGLGRLAALRLGSRVLLTSRPLEEPEREYHLLIDWEDYNEVSLVEDIDLKIEGGKRSKGAASGSEITLENLHTGLSRNDVKRLARELILLADPFGDNKEGFKPQLVAPEFQDLANLVKGRYFDEAEYHMKASIDGHGRVEAAVLDWKGQELFKATHQDLARERRGERYVAPKLTFDLWVFILDAEAFSTRKASLGEVREWLNAFGGVHIYQDGLRVTPYGDPGNDWLDLNLSRARNPEERPSTNTVIGRVSIKDKEQLLIQKTDRSGFIESEAFRDMRAFAQDALEWMARRRMEVAQRKRAQARAAAFDKEKPAKRNLDAAIDKAPAAVRNQIKEAAAVNERAHQADKDRLRKEIQLYRTLSTAGITAATFAHESSGNPVKVITQSILAIERRAKENLGDKYGVLAKPIGAISQAIKSLAVLGAATLKLIDHEKRRLSKVPLNTTIRNVVTTFEPFTLGRDVAVVTNLASGDPYLRASEAAIESIVTNLLNNSLAALEESDSKKRVIHISTTIEGSCFRMTVADNGPGIKDLPVADIWLPGVSSKPNGTGLGLTIVRDTVDDLGGTVRAMATGTLGGAEITIELPILGL